MKVKGVRNIYGRKPTRGWRPFFLIPKVLCAGVYLGGLAAANVIWWHRQSATDAGNGYWQVQAVSLLFRWLIIPALVATLVFGLLLFLQHPRVFWAMRWIKLKISILVVVLPTLHLTMRPLLGRVKAGYGVTATEASRLDAQTAAESFGVELALAFLITGMVVFIGRHKPRLGQPSRTGAPASHRG